MVPGPKARMQGRDQGARLSQPPGASMVPGPKARMQASRKPTATYIEKKCFNGARPEGQDAGLGGARVDRHPRHASMVPGPKARMQGGSATPRRAASR